MKLIPIPKGKYEEYRLSAIFDCYKWDPQFLDNNTVAKYALVLTEEEYEEVKSLTEMLDKETVAAEQFLNNHLECAKELQLSKEFHKEIRTMGNYDPKKHIRLMRYDFHPVEDGKWAISEVNSDVPGGYAEASLLPLAAIEATGLQDCWFNSFGDNLVNAIMEKTKPNGTVMLVHCTSYSDDRQVMQYLGDRLEEHGIKAVYGAADHVNFEDGKAFCILDGNEGEIDVIVRFTPLEWVKNVKPKKWQGYFNTETPSCNHPIAIFAQTKKFPLVWDELEANGKTFTVTDKLFILSQEELEEYLNDKIKESYTKPIFVLSHLALNYSMRTFFDGDGQYAKYIFDVLNEAGKNGLNIVYPKENNELYEKLSKNALILSEYPFNTRPQASNFPRRNRIVSGLSKGVLVVEASVKSGSLITAHQALEQGRDIYAIPGSPFDNKTSGCNKLLKDGAILVESSEDILNNFYFEEVPHSVMV